MLPIVQRWKDIDELKCIELEATTVSKDVGNIVSVECKEHKVLGLANHVREELIIIGESPKWRQNNGNTFDKKKLSGPAVNACYDSVDQAY